MCCSLSNIYFLSSQPQAQGERRYQHTCIAFIEPDQGHIHHAPHPSCSPPSLKATSPCQNHSRRQPKGCQERLPRPTFQMIFLSIQLLRSNMKCRMQATAHRISSFKYVTGGGSSHGPRIVHHIWSGRQLIHRKSASRKWNFWPTHIFCQQVLYYPLPPTTPGRWHGELAYAELWGDEEERWIRSGWAQCQSRIVLPVVADA